MTHATPHTTLHPTFSPEAATRLDALWDTWDTLAAVAEFHGYNDQDANDIADDAWAVYETAKLAAERGY